MFCLILSVFDIIMQIIITYNTWHFVDVYFCYSFFADSPTSPVHWMWYPSTLCTYVCKVISLQILQEILFASNWLLTGGTRKSQRGVGDLNSKKKQVVGSGTAFWYAISGASDTIFFHDSLPSSSQVYIEFWFFALKLWSKLGYSYGFVVMVMTALIAPLSLCLCR